MELRVPVPAQELEEGPEVTLKEDRLKLTLLGEDRVAVVEFVGVKGFQFNSFAVCSADQMEAYGKVVEILRSTWIESVTRSSHEALGTIHHYRIFLDEVGCYDVLCSDVKLSEELSSHAQ